MVSSVFFGPQSLLADRFYGIVLVCLNGTAPMMEVFATQSPYAFGKIRVWGTIGYSVGVQIAGWVYHQFSP